MLSALVNLFFPKVCYGCLNIIEDNQDTICVNCRHDLPVTNFHFDRSDAVKKILYGRAKIENGTALFRFEKKGLVQQLIHGLKYKGYENIGFVLGNWLGAELKSVPEYNDIDLVIPVPLHKKKLKKRGYNQVTKFGQQIAAQLNVDFKEDILVKITDTTSQVFKKRFSRWEESNTMFSAVHLNALNNKHILLVDDLITTGATMEACINELCKANNVKISIASMAMA